LRNERTFRRKVAEAMVSLELRQTFHQATNLRVYANGSILGNASASASGGFSKASVADFGKELRHFHFRMRLIWPALFAAPNILLPKIVIPRVMQARVVIACSANARQ